MSWPSDPASPDPARGVSGHDGCSPRHHETRLSPFLLERAKHGEAGHLAALTIERGKTTPEERWA